MWKNSNVFLLSTNNICHATYCLNSLELHTDGKISLNGIQQHLYITSNEKLVGGDYVIPNEPYNTQVWKYKCSPCPLPYWGNKDTCKKIIATTDDLLVKNISRPLGVVQELSKITNKFIKQYIEEYNKGNVITKVEVEYEVLVRTDAPFNRQRSLNENTKVVLKVNPDNTINIKPIKDSWNREKVHRLLYNAIHYSKGKVYPHDLEWIKENL